MKRLDWFDRLEDRLGRVWAYLLFYGGPIAGISAIYLVPKDLPAAIQVAIFLGAILGGILLTMLLGMLGSRIFDSIRWFRGRPPLEKLMREVEEQELDITEARAQRARQAFLDSSEAEQRRTILLQMQQIEHLLRSTNRLLEKACRVLDKAWTMLIAIVLFAGMILIFGRPR